jgi:DNA-binding XRE family transcriptional regulator
MNREGRAMLTKEFSETYASLPEHVKSAILALSILIDRVGSLPKPDRDDLFELLQAWRSTSEPEDQASIQRAMEEVLAQTPITVRTLPLTEDKPLTRNLKAWADHVGNKIKQLRENAGLNQSQLAERAGLTQSHISRLENAEHSATNLTLGKIARALDVSIGEIDPCVD